MSDDLWRVPLHNLMLNAVHVRAQHYREQAAQLRRMAEDERNPKSRADLVDLADKYDDLANTVSSRDS
jgi:hypothetical protein